MTSNITNIPAPRVPIVDPKTGVAAKEWYRFFANLFVLLGSGSSTFTTNDLALSPLADTSASSKDAQIAQLMAMVTQQSQLIETLSLPPSPPAVVVDDVLPRIEVVTVIDDLSPRYELGTIASLNAGVNAAITTADLVGKTITVTNGIITNYA